MLGHSLGLHREIWSVCASELRVGEGRRERRRRKEKKKAYLASDGAHQNQATTNLEVLVGLAGDKELATGVDGKDTVKFLRGDVLDVAEGDDAAVGANDVELAKDLDGLLEHPDDVLDDTNVGLDAGSVRAVLLDGGDDLLGGLGAVGVVDNDLAATTTELHGHFPADTTACSGERYALVT